MALEKYKLNGEDIQKLVSYGCSIVEIGDYFGCHETLIHKKYSEFIKKGRSDQKIKLRKLQWEAAKKGNITMLIWLGKQILGQKEKVETETKNVNIDAKDDPDIKKDMMDWAKAFVKQDKKEKKKEETKVDGK